jgi:hypothetical protein
MKISMKNLNWWLRWLFLRVGREVEAHNGMRFTTNVSLFVCLPWYLYSEKPSWIPRFLWGYFTLLVMEFSENNVAK